MSRLRLNIDEFLTRSGVALTNAQGTPEILAALEQFGYNAARLQEGAALLEQAQALTAVQKKEYGDQFAATEALAQARDQADALYGVHRKLAALALKNDPQRRHALGLDQSVKQTFAGWLAQATIFYTNLLADAATVTALGRYNINQAALQQAQTFVQQATELNAAQEKEKGEAQQATKVRDAALDALDEWMVEFKQVAQIALAGSPQQLEALQFGAVA